MMCNNYLHISNPVPAHAAKDIFQLTLHHPRQGLPAQDPNRVPIPNWDEV
jgi:hypothetical protein